MHKFTSRSGTEYSYRDEPDPNDLSDYDATSINNIIEGMANHGIRLREPEFGPGALPDRITGDRDAYFLPHRDEGHAAARDVIRKVALHLLDTIPKSNDSFAIAGYTPKHTRIYDKIISRYAHRSPNHTVYKVKDTQDPRYNIGHAYFVIHKDHEPTFRETMSPYSDIVTKLARATIHTFNKAKEPGSLFDDPYGQGATREARVDATHFYKATPTPNIERGIGVGMRLLGAEGVPYRVLRSGNTGLVSVPKIPNSNTLNQGPNVSHLHPHDVAHILASEWLMGVVDRHSGNYVISPRGAHSIDYGYAWVHNDDPESEPNSGVMSALYIKMPRSTRNNLRVQPTYIARMNAVAPLIKRHMRAAMEKDMYDEEHIGMAEDAFDKRLKHLNEISNNGTRPVHVSQIGVDMPIHLARATGRPVPPEAIKDRNSNPLHGIGESFIYNGKMYKLSYRPYNEHIVSRAFRATKTPGAIRTWEGEHEGKPLSISEFEPGAKRLDYHMPGDRKLITALATGGVGNILLSEHLMGIQDRHGGNYIISPRGVHSIDHEASLYGRPLEDPQDSHLYNVYKRELKTEPTADAEHLRRWMRYAPKLLDHAKQANPLMYPKVARHLIRALHRAKELLAVHGNIPIHMLYDQPAQLARVTNRPVPEGTFTYGRPKEIPASANRVRIQNGKIYKMAWSAPIEHIASRAFRATKTPGAIRTWEGNYHGRSVSISEFEQGARPLGIGIHNYTGEGIPAEHIATIPDILLSETLMGTGDRHGENYIISPRGVHSIDHDGSLGQYTWRKSDGSQQYVPYGTYGESPLATVYRNQTGNDPKASGEHLRRWMRYAPKLLDNLREALANDEPRLKNATQYFLSKLHRAKRLLDRDGHIDIRELANSSPLEYKARLARVTNRPVPQEAMSAEPTYAVKLNRFPDNFDPTADKPEKLATNPVWFYRGWFIKQTPHAKKEELASRAHVATKTPGAVPVKAVQHNGKWYSVAPEIEGKPVREVDAVRNAKQAGDIILSDLLTHSQDRHADNILASKSGLHSIDHEMALMNQQSPVLPHILYRDLVKHGIPPYASAKHLQRWIDYAPEYRRMITDEHFAPRHLEAFDRLLEAATSLADQHGNVPLKQLIPEAWRLKVHHGD